MQDRPIDRLLAWARARKLNQTQLALRLGRGPQDITNWKSRGMPPECVPDAARLMGTSVDALLYGATPDEGGVAGELLVTYTVPPLLREKDLTQINGEFRYSLVDAAMAPEHPQGTQVIFDPARAPRPGLLVLARTAHGQVVVRLYAQGKTPDRWLAKARHPAFVDFDSEDDGLQVLGTYRGMYDPGD